MQKKQAKKLTLSRETILRLEAAELRQALGGSGGWSDDSVCPTTHPTGN